VARIVAPRAGALITGDSVRAVITVRSAPKGFRAELDGRRRIDVTGRFRRTRHGELAATLRVGRQLAVGENHLFVVVPRRVGSPVVTSAHFVVARPRGGMLSAREARNAVHAPVTTQARVAAGATLLATLNGRSVRGQFKQLRGNLVQAQLAASDGLRFGGNRLTLTAFDRRGHYQRLRRSFAIRRDRPLVGAGHDRRVLAGVRVRLDGSSTRASRRRTRLGLRWTIIARPKGSKARLLGRGRARPTLVTDVPGHYTVQLQAREARPASTRGRGARIAAPAISPTSSDAVTLTAQPDVLPGGIPVATIVSDSKPGIQVGLGFYPAGTGSGTWAEMVVLDRATLGEISNSTYTGNAQGMASLATDVGNLSNADLVIVSGIGRPAALSSTAQHSLHDALAGSNGIGAALPQGTSPLLFGNWSVIGVPGTPSGTAHQCIETFCWIHPGAVLGEMAGSLQLDISDNYAFAWQPTFDTFDTQAQGSTSTQNVMQITFGDTSPESYPSAQMNGPAVQLLRLDPGTLAVLGNFTYSTSTGSTCGGSGCLQDLANQLRQIANDPTPGMIMLTSFGQPNVSASGAPGTWAQIAQTLQGMGANPWVLLGLNGTGDYTFVGAEGLPALDGPNAGAELSQVETGAASARLTGVFVRDNLGLWQAGTNGNPTATDGPATFEPDLAKILAQTPQPFPAFNTRGEQAAQQYIATQLAAANAPLTVDPFYGLRANYWSNDASIDWGVEASTLDGIGPCQSSCPAGYDSADFQSVKKELTSEFNGVAAVMDFFTGGKTSDIAGLMESVATAGAYTFEGTAYQINQLFNPPSAHGIDLSDIIQGALWTSSGFAGIIPGAEEFAAPLGIAAGMLQFEQGVTNNPDGTSALDPTAFDNNMKKWGANLASLWLTSIDSVGLLADQLVGDKGRLDAAVEEINDFRTNPDQGWGLDPQNENALQQSMSRSLGQYMYRTMLPTLFSAYQCVVPEVPDGNNPWLLENNATPSYAQWPVTAIAPDYLDGGTRVGPGILSIGIPRDKPRFPPKSIVQTLFGTNFDNGDLSLSPNYFLAPAVGGSPGFKLNTGTFYNWDFKLGFDLYNCAGNSWQSNVSN
jgi:hypothetical protein